MQNWVSLSLCDKEALAFGFLVRRNIHTEMQRKPGIHPIPKETTLG